eukprot:TRINITY_DN58491_c0_g1_i1.p1 TRINITY_DN58491_c0_g1~~TRINITY_DN58491_c0_g1_i1.p1  ORF type:complete len:347 (+),score=46.03 TRINITY_DN58491_c0_g1_i1:118-1158(+)
MGSGAPPKLLEEPLIIERTPCHNTPLDWEGLRSQDIGHGGNRKVPPELWGLTVTQFQQFIDLCRKDAQAWNNLRSSTDYGKEAGVVNGYQICDNFVKPLTRGTGSGVALVLNPRNPLKAEVMISHTWAEDILQLQEALYDRAADEEAGPGLAVWICLLAMYQPGGEQGDTGLSIGDQLKLEPFKMVILLPTLRYMCLIVTSTQDPYERLWCVYELSTALDVMRKLADEGDARSQGFVKTEYSDAAVAKIHQSMKKWAREEATSAGLSDDMWLNRHELGPEYSYYMSSVKCQDAKCSDPQDEQMIRNRVEAAGGWQRLNEQVAEFRRPKETKLVEDPKKTKLDEEML